MRQRLRIVERRVPALVRRRYSYEACCVLYCLVPALVAAGELDALREFLANSLTGAVLTDDAVRTGVVSCVTGTYNWKADDGHCHGNPDTFVLIVRGLNALLEEDTDAELVVADPMSRRSE
eukprot:6837880-Prymnesium_polylepis.1